MQISQRTAECADVNEQRVSESNVGVQSFCPNFALHPVVTHAMFVLEHRSLALDYAIRFHMRLQPSNTVITSVIAVCKLQSGLKPLKRLYAQHGHTKIRYGVEMYNSVINQHLTHQITYVSIVTGYTIGQTSQTPCYYSWCQPVYSYCFTCCSCP